MKNKTDDDSGNKNITQLRKSVVPPEAPLPKNRKNGDIPTSADAENTATGRKKPRYARYPINCGRLRLKV